MEYFLTNEQLTKPLINNPQELHKISLNSFLGNYLSTLSDPDFVYKNTSTILYPNPTNGTINIESADTIGQEYKITDNLGKIVKEGILNTNTIYIGDFPKAIYIFSFPKTKQTYKIIKQ